MTGPSRKKRLTPDHGPVYHLAKLAESSDNFAEASDNFAEASKYFASFYRRLRQSPPKASGERSHKIEIDEIVCWILRACHEANLAPPIELVELVELALDYDFTDKPADRAHLPEPFDKLTNYFVLNPEASKRQAHRDTGLARATIDKYMAHPKWGEVLAAKKELYTPDEISSGDYDADFIASLASIYPYTRLLSRRDIESL